MRKFALNLTRQFLPEPAARDLLLKVAENTDEETALRIQAINALSPVLEDTRERLQRLARYDPDPEIRRITGRALGD